MLEIDVTHRTTLVYIVRRQASSVDHTNVVQVRVCGVMQWGCYFRRIMYSLNFLRDYIYVRPDCT